MVTFLVTNNFLLLSQIEFTCIIHCYLPPLNEGGKKCMNLGWGFTFRENHWSTLETTKQFIQKILSYLHTQICHLELQESQEIMWLSDCWSMHKDHDFLDWMKETHLNILVIFIPANCINVL